MVGAYIQFAVMFTTETGERRIRVINHKFDVSAKLETVYDSIDYLSFANITARNCTSGLMRGESAVKVREETVAWLGSVLGEFMGRGSLALSAKFNDINLPLNMCWAVSYLHNVLNSRMFLSFHKMPTDARVEQILSIQRANPYIFATKFYPKLYPLTLDIYEGDPLPGDFIDNEDEEEDE